MNTFVAKPSIWRIVLIALGAFGFTVLGAWLAGLLGSKYPEGREWLGWLCLTFFGLCAVVAARRVFERDDVVRISSSGIWYRHWSNDIIPWKQIIEIQVWQRRRQKALLLILADPERFPSTTLLGKLAGANRALTGGDITVSVIGTDRSFDELAAAVMEYRPQ